MTTIEEEISKLDLESWDEDSDGDLYISGTDTHKIAEYVRSKLRELGEEIKKKAFTETQVGVVTATYTLPFAPYDIDAAIDRMCTEEPPKEGK